MAVPEASQLVSGLFAEKDWSLAPAWPLNLRGNGIDSMHISNGGDAAISKFDGEENDNTWGTFDVGTPRFMINSDAAIVAPLTFAYVLGE